MKTNEEQLNEWTVKYYRLVFQQAFFVCRDRYAAERIAEQTFLAAYKNIRKIRKSDDVKGWIMHAARYFILKEVYSSRELGETVTEKFRLPESLDMETVHALIVQYEECDGNNTK